MSSALTRYLSAPSGRRLWSGIGVLLVLTSLGCARVPSPNSPSAPSMGDPPSSVGTVAPAAEDGLDSATLMTVARTKVLFGHRSVGASIVEQGITAVYAEHGLASPVASAQSPHGSFRDEWLTQTEEPLDKLKEFDAWFRVLGMGDDVQVAAMKLGYLDVGPQTDTGALFDQYVNLMDGLERDFPATRFLHSTITVTQWDPEANAAIERFNARMRSRYGSSGRLVDLAWVLSDCPGVGRKAKTTEAGEPYYTLCDDFSADGGHPSELGAAVAAEELLRVIAHSTHS